MDLFSKITDNLFYVSLGINICLLLLIVYLVRTIGNFERNNQSLWNKLDRIDQKTQSIELENLEAKLNPHLFKNILNSIQSHAYQTYYSMEKLANVLDFILYESRERMVSAKEEIDFALNLIEIHKIKLSPIFDLKIKSDIDESDAFYQENLIAPLITIDLIENAFKHADFQNQEGFIHISLTYKNKYLEIEVNNKISPRNNLNNEKGGIGTQNFIKRLNIIYKDCYLLEKHQKDDVYFAKLKIDLNAYKNKMHSN